MPLTSQQIKDLKSQLSQQIQHLPEAQKKSAQAQIDAMSDEAIETMLQEQQSKAPSKPIFRAIVAGEIPSKKIEETPEAIAVLDIKPISVGHVVIISKAQVTKETSLPKPIFKFANLIGKRIISKLKAQSFQIAPESKFEEIILNVIPIYDKPLNLQSPRIDISQEQLNQIQKKLAKKTKPKVIKLNANNTPKAKPSQIIKLKRRIP